MAKLRSTSCVSGLILTLVFVLSSSSAPAQALGFRMRNSDTDRAYRLLLHAGIFNLGGAGFGLTMTKEEGAFRVLLRSANSIALFEQLAREGNPEGQLYALYGLYLEEPDAFHSEVDRLKRDDGPPARWEGFMFIEKGKIRSAKGCILFDGERSAILDQMARGSFNQAFKSLSATLKH
jgi:hypothetical protein